MINRIYRLVDTKRIEMVQREVKLVYDSILVRPDIMSICAADQRYYYGNRKREILTAKLPMALIHEAIGTVLYDFGGKHPAGTKVAMFPLEVKNEDATIKANYRSGSNFNSSGTDGFMQDIVALPQGRIVPLLEKDTPIYVFSEIVSVAVNAIGNLKAHDITDKTAFGVWGDGSMGYIMALTIKAMFPKSKLYVFGKTARKLHKFSFADKAVYINNLPSNVQINNCFECVGSKSSEVAIEQMLNVIIPQGSIHLLGVSEEPININTRIVLEKGLTLNGNNRSDINDFIKAVELIRCNGIFRKYLPMLISETIEVKDEDDIRHAFEQDLLNDFKTIIKWSI